MLLYPPLDIVCRAWYMFRLKKKLLQTWNKYNAKCYRETQTEYILYLTLCNWHVILNIYQSCVYNTRYKKTGQIWDFERMNIPLFLHKNEFFFIYILEIKKRVLRIHFRNTYRRIYKNTYRRIYRNTYRRI